MLAVSAPASTCHCTRRPSCNLILCSTHVMRGLGTKSVPRSFLPSPPSPGPFFPPPAPSFPAPRLPCSEPPAGRAPASPCTPSLPPLSARCGALAPSPRSRPLSCVAGPAPREPSPISASFPGLSCLSCLLKAPGRTSPDPAVRNGGGGSTSKGTALATVGRGGAEVVGLGMDGRRPGESGGAAEGWVGVRERWRVRER